MLLARLLEVLASMIIEANLQVWRDFGYEKDYDSEEK